MNRLARRLVLSQSADVLTFCLFFMLVHESVHTERNPLIAIPYLLGGFAAVAVMKMTITLVVAYRSSRPKEVSPWFARLHVIAISAATASGIAGAGFNLASLVDALRVH